MVVEVEEEVAEEVKTTTPTGPILNQPIHNHNKTKHRHKLSQPLVVMTLMPHVRYYSPTLLRPQANLLLDGGYQNYVALWYQALAQQQGGPSQGDPSKPPGTS